jgi:hypothetical protein
MTGVRVPHFDDAPGSRDVMAGRLGLDREFAVRACGCARDDQVRKHREEHLDDFWLTKVRGKQQQAQSG